MPPIAPWTARPLLFEVAQASKRVFTPRFGRQLRLEPLDTDTAGRVATQYHWSTHRGHRSLDLHFKIPRAVCVGTNAQGQPHMPGSAVLACFDHFSTYAISEADRTYRPGVSVSLNAAFADGHEELLRPDRTMVMRCTVPKIGSNLAFASAEVLIDNSFVARLSHVKFMPLRGVFGFVWDRIFSPSGIKFMQKFGGFTRVADQPTPTEPLELRKSVDELLEFHNIRNCETGGGLIADLGAMNWEQTNPLVCPLVTAMSAPCRIRTFCAFSCPRNTMERCFLDQGDLHGGCQAMLSEKLSSQVVTPVQNNTSRSLRGIQMMYYRAGPGNEPPTLMATPMLNTEMTNPHIETCVVGKDGRVLSEGLFTYQPRSITTE